jgi:hypothetical protein
MKKVLFLSSLLLVAGIATSFTWSHSADSAMKKLTIKFVYNGVVEGYDHDNKMVATIDDDATYESEVKPTSKNNKLVISLPKGKHTIHLTNYAFYEGNWEERTLDNNYTFDCIFEKEINLKKSMTLDLVFDLDERAVIEK